MSNKIIIPIIDLPRSTGATLLFQQANTIARNFQNSPLFQVSEALSASVKQINDTLHSPAIAEFQRRQMEMVKNMAEINQPFIQLAETIRSTFPQIIFQPVVYDAPPQKSYQKPSVDLPQVLIVSRKASLHFNGAVLEIGNINTQPVKAVQYFCDHIGEEIDLAVLFMQCKNKDRGKHTSRREIIDLPARYSRGEKILFELYRIEGFSSVFRLKSNHKTVIPYLV